MYCQSRGAESMQGLNYARETQEHNHHLRRADGSMTGMENALLKLRR